MNPSPYRSPLLLLAALTLTGCMQDSASYVFPEKDHAITLVRNQAWPWQDSMSVEVVAIRLPECNEGLSVKDIPLRADIALFKAPDDYPEPIFILSMDQKKFAVSTQSCRIQEFKEAPPDPGIKLGRFREIDGKFSFVPEGS
jgi:hypothetical protein